jgi:hypothetical protein
MHALDVQGRAAAVGIDEDAAIGDRHRSRIGRPQELVRSDPVRAEAPCRSIRIVRVSDGDEALLQLGIVLGQQQPAAVAEKTAWPAKVRPGVAASSCATAALHEIDHDCEGAGPPRHRDALRAVGAHGDGMTARRQRGNRAGYRRAIERDDLVWPAPSARALK